MANKYRGEVQIRLDRTRTLKFGFSAYARFDRVHGRKLIDVFQEIQSAGKNKHIASIGFDVLGDLLYAGLSHEDKDLTPDDALELADQADGESQSEKLEYIITKLFEAISAAEGPDGVKKKAKEGMIKKTRAGRKLSAQV